LTSLAHPWTDQLVTTRPSLAEIFGVLPLGKAARELALALRGDAYTPASRFGASSLRILAPRQAIATWFGKTRSDRRVPIYNLFNRSQTPIEDGWSVRVSQVRDFRGGTLTYDSHNGTDFVVPVGTVVVAAAPARVLRVSNELNRGGLKIILDHGRGLVTTSNHLSRALVKPGDQVARGEPVALSGASGIDFLLLFPWNVPHVHYNVWLGGEPVDPFAAEGEVALWRDGNDPTPLTSPAPEDRFEPTDFDPEAVASAISGCRDAELGRALEATEPFERRAGDVLFFLNYYPTRFARRPPLMPKVPREPRLDLPFRATDFVGITFD
jgi:murein DD-endopeptidase